MTLLRDVLTGLAIICGLAILIENHDTDIWWLDYLGVGLFFTGLDSRYRR